MLTKTRQNRVIVLVNTDASSCVLLLSEYVIHMTNCPWLDGTFGKRGKLRMASGRMSSSGVNMAAEIFGPRDY